MRNKNQNPVRKEQVHTIDKNRNFSSNLNLLYAKGPSCSLMELTTMIRPTLYLTRIYDFLLLLPKLTFLFIPKNLLKVIFQISQYKFIME